MNEVEQAIADQWAEFKAVALKGDAEGWASFWTPDAWLMEPGIDQRGQGLFDFVTEFFESGGKVFTLDFESVEIFVHGDVAYQIGRIDETFQFPGKDPGEVHNHLFSRWDKQPDGAWRIHRCLVGPRDEPEEG